MNSSLPTPQGQFGAPLGGVTALDLLESFGFEGGLEAVTHEPSSPTSPTSSEFPFRCKLFRLDRSFVQIIELHFYAAGSPGPALLDLSLPISPKSPTNKSMWLVCSVLSTISPSFPYMHDYLDYY